MHRNKSRFFRFIARFLGAKKAASAPAFLVAAGLATFAAAPAHAATTATIDASVTEGDYSADNLAFGSGQISFGGTAAASVADTTTLSARTELTIESSGAPLDFGKLQFQAPDSVASVTVAARGVVFASVQSSNNYGKIAVNENAQLTITGDAALSRIEASGELNFEGAANVQTLVAKTGGNVTLANAGGVTVLSMQGGVVNVSDFALDHVQGSSATATDAAGSINASGALTVNEDVSLTAADLNLSTRTGGSVMLKEGSSLDLGAGDVSLAAGTTLTIGDAGEAAKSETLKAERLVAEAGATTVLNGGTLELTGDGITQNLDSLDAGSSGLVDVSGEDAIAEFSAAKTFAGELDLRARAGTLEVADGVAVSTAGTVDAKNLTIGSGAASVKATAFTLGEEGTLTMRGGTLDLSATNGGVTNIYGIADNSSGTITEGTTAGTIRLNKSATTALTISAANGTVELADQGDEAPISVSASNLTADNLVVGKNTLTVNGPVTAGTVGQPGTGLSLDGGTLLGRNVLINKLDGTNTNGKIAALDAGYSQVTIDTNGTNMQTGALTLGDAATNKIYVKGDTLTLGSGSSVTANNLYVGANPNYVTTFDISVDGITLNVNNVELFQDDVLKLSDTQTVIGSKSNVAGTIKLGDAQSLITTRGQLKSLGQTTMNGGTIESTGADIAATETSDPVYAIELGDVSMGNGNLYATGGTVKVGAVSDQGVIAAKHAIVGSISDSAANKVQLAEAKTNTWQQNDATALDSLTFTGPAASNISSNGNSSVNTQKLVLGDGVSVTLGRASGGNANVLVEQTLKVVELGEKATLSTYNNNGTEELNALTNVSLAAGDATKKTSWTHGGNAMTITGTLDMADYAKLETQKAMTISGTATLNDNDELVSSEESVTVSGDLTAGDDLTVSAAKNVSVTGATNVGDSAAITAGTAATGGDITLTGDATFGADATLTAGTDTTSGNIAFNNDATFDAGATLTASQAITVAGDLTTEDADGETVGDLTINAGTSATVEGDLTTGDDLAITAAQNVTVKGSTSAGDRATLTATAGDIALGDDADADATTFGENATLTAGRDILLKGETSFDQGATLAATRAVTAVGSLEIANNSEVTATNGAIDLSGAELKLGNSEITLKTESATAGDVLLSKVSGINGLAVAKVDAAKNIVFKNDASADVDVQAGLGLDAQEIVVEDGANVQIVNGFVNTRNRLTKVSVRAGATFDLRGNNNELAGTPAVVPHNLTAVELADGGTLVVGGVNPLGEDVYVTYATATSIANALLGVTGTIVVAGNGTGANDAPIHSTLTAATVGSVATGGVNVTLNDGGELVATADDMHVAALNGTGGALTASDGTTKHDVVVTASNALGQNIAITADELRVTDLADDGTDVTVTLSKLDLSNVDSLAVADAYAGAASHSTLEITETAGEDGSQLDWTHLDVSVGETVGAETHNGTLKLTQGTNVAIGELAVVGDASVLEIDGSALEAASVAGDALAGTLKLTDGALTLTDDADVTFANAALSDGTLTVNGDAKFTNALAAGASGTIEANDVSFMAGTGSTGALTLNAGVSRDAEGEIVGADGQVNFSGESAFGEGSEINAKTIFAVNFGADFTADATQADVNFLENVSAVGAALKTAEDFTGADGAKAALKNVSVYSGGVFENDGDLTIEDSLKLGGFATAGTVKATGDVFVDAPITDNATTPGAAVGTIEGANVEINLTEQLSGPGIANTLEIKATATDGAITLSGATDGAEFVFDAKLTAEKLVVGTTAGEGETEVSTQVKITNPDEALAGVASEIEINELDSLRLVQAWSPAQNNLTVTNAGTLTLDGKLTVSAGKSFSVAGGQSEFKDGVENNGAFALTDAASATAKTWTDAATGATLSLTGTQTANAELTVSEGDTTINSELSASNAELTQTAGSLAIAGGAGTTVENLTIRTLEADKTISFTTNAFDASGKVTVSTVAGAADADKVQVAADVSLGEASSITTTTLDVADDKTASVHGKIAVTNIELNDRGTLTLKGDNLSGDAEASTFTNLENGAGAVVNVLNGATLTQNAGAAAIALNGALNVSGMSADKATFAAAGDMTVAGTGSVALSDYGVLDVGNGTLKLETGATLSLASGAFAEIAALDLTESVRGAVTVDGFGMSANDAATVKVGTLKMKDAIAAGDEGTIQLTGGGKLVADDALGKILVTDHDGAGNIWVDAYSQFELKAGNIVVTEETRGEIIASSGNVVFEQEAAGNYELSGVGTENLYLPARGRQSLAIRIAEYYDDAVPEYTYSHVDVRRETSLTNADLTIEDIERDASTADRTLGDLGNARFDNSTLTVTGVAANEENLGERVTLEVSEGLKLTNNSRATISDVELAGASGFSVALSGNSSLTATDATISGFDRVNLNDADFKADGATLKGVDLWVDNSGQLSVADGGLELADGAVVSINNGGSLELKGDVATIDDESALVLNGGNVAVAAADVEVSRLSVSSNSAIEADDGAGDEPTLTLANANVTSDATLGVSGVAIDAETLTLDAGGALNSDETVDVDTLNLNGGALSSTGDVTVTNAVADAKGKISADTLTLEDGLSGDGVEIDADTLALQGTLSGDVNAGDIGRLKIASGTEATLSGGDLSFDALATNVEGSLTVSDEAEVSLGELTASDLTLSGATANAESATITDLTLDDGALVATGDVEIENAVADASGSISGADVALNGVSEAAGAQVDLTASGTLTLGGTAAVSGAVTAGTLSVEGDATLSGEVSAGVTNVSGSLTLDGSETVSLGELTASDLTLSGATANADSATIEDLTLSGGALVATGDVEVANAVANASGSISGADVELNGVSEAAGGQVDLTASGTLTLRNETTIENGSVAAGTLAVEGDATLKGAVEADETNVSGSLTIDGAADVALGAATVFGDGELVVRDSTVSGDFGFADDADGAKISINDSTVNGNVTLSGEGNELGLKNATINGDLVAGEGTVTIAGENSAETISLSDAKIVQEAGSTLTATSILVKDYELAAGATVESGVTVKGGSAAIAGTVDGNLRLDDSAADSTLSGTVTGALKLENGSVLSTSGTVNGSTTVKENSELTQTDGTLADVSVNASTFAQNGGTAASVTLKNGATFTQTAGDAGAVVANASTATIGGTVASIDAASNSNVTVSGTVNGSTAVKSGSELVSTGTLAEVSVNDATFTQTAGDAGAVEATRSTVTIDGTVASIDAVNSEVTVSGTVNGSTAVKSGSELVSTGTLADVSVNDATFTQNGGTVNGTVSLTNGAELTQTDGWISDLEVAVDTTAKLGGSTTNLTVAGAVEATANQSFTTVTLNGGSIVGGENEIAIAQTVENANGTISAKEITLATGLTGGASGARVVAETLNLEGTLSGKADVDVGALNGTSATLSGAALDFNANTTIAETLTVSDNADVSLGGVSVTDTLTLDNAKVTADSVSADTLALNGELTVSGDVDIANTVENASGSIEAAELTLGGGLVASGDTVIDADTLNLKGELSGKVYAELEALVVADDATLSGEDLELVADATTVSGTLTVSGADVELGDVTVSGTLDIENSTVTGDLAFAFDAQNATISITGSTVDGGVTLTGENNLNLSDAEITGDLVAESGTLSFSGENKAGAVNLEGATIVQTAGSTLTATDILVGSYELEEGATVGSNVRVNGGPATIAGSVDGNLTLNNVGADTSSTLSGEVDGNLTLNSSVLSVSGTVTENLTLATVSTLTVSGTVEGSTTVKENSELTQTDGVLADVSVNDSTFMQNGGEAAAVTLENGAAFTQAAGSQAGAVVADASTAAIGGTVASIDAAASNVAVSGAVNGATTLTNGSELVATGSLSAVSAKASTFTQNGGMATNVTLTDGATFTQTAGETGAVVAVDSTVEIGGAVSLVDAVNSAVTVSGTVRIEARIEAGSTLTQNGGLLGATTIDDATFTQNAGMAASVTLKNDATLDQDVDGKIDALTVKSGATANLAGETAVLAVAGTVNVLADQTFGTVALEGGSIVGEKNVTINGEMTDASGSISGKNVSLNGISGSASVSATETLTLSGSTTTSGTLTAGTLAVDGSLTAKSSQISAGSTEIAGTLDLTVDTDALSGLSVSGTANLASEDKFVLSLDGGNGTVNKSGSGALTLGDAAGFTGTLDVEEGDAALTAGKTFGGDVNFASGTFTGGAGATVAGTLAMGAGTTLEIGDRSGAATFTVGKLASPRVRSAETTAVVHDLYAWDSVDMLKVTDATTDLSGFTAIVRSDLVNERELGAEGVTLDLIDGAVAAGYGSVAGEGFEFVNLALAGDGTKLSVVLNYRGAASGLGGDAFDANQRSVAGALPTIADGRLGEYLDALKAAGSAAETAHALDVMGATHLVSMMPAQIAGTWNHVQSLNNAIGQSSVIGDFEQQFGAWAQYVGSSNDVDATKDRKSWKRTMSGGMVGFEYAASPKFLLGAAVGYEDSKLKSAGNTTDDSAYFLDFYLRGRSGNFTQKASLTLAQHNYDADRSLSVGGLHDRVTGSTDGFTLAGNYELSYGHKLNKYVSLHPLATVSAAFNSIDGWTEHGAGNASLTYEDSEAWTFLAGVGARAELRLPILNSDMDLMPTLGVHAVLMGEFGDRSDDLRARFTGTGSSFETSYDDSSACMLDVGVTLAAPITERVSLIGGISSRIRSDETNMNANLGVRIGW